MVNQQFTFSVHIMAVLAFADGKVIDSRTLAASVNTNPVVVRRLLLALRDANLIRTYAGKLGGAKLIRAPQRITLFDIYDAIEPRPIIALNERKPSRHCPVSCSMKRIMGGIAHRTDNAVRKQLRVITLHDLVQQIG